MRMYLTPDAYVGEIPSTNKPIEGVGTAVAAFIGLAPGGPSDEATGISNWTQFAGIYGDPNKPDHGPFMEGAYLAHAVYGFFQNGGGIAWILRVGSANGDQATRAALPAAARLDQVTMIVMPDLMTLDGGGKQMRELQGEMIAHCEKAGTRMAILDAPAGMLPQDVLDWRMNTAGYDSKLAALYYPWIEVMDPIKRCPMMVPPSGHIAGIWSRVDGTRGVHMAPANEVILGATGLGAQISEKQQGELNRAGLNCIRSFPRRGLRVWGVRTLSSELEWRYINVRRVFNYVCESIMQGTRWAAFQPSDERLWASLTISISDFLDRVWREGALFGSKPADAFFVKCDSETNPPEVIETGQVVCEIGVALVKPAEFVIFQVSQFTK
jgi:uncharacterized protein